jgi:hypothetical protein
VSNVPWAHKLFWTHPMVLLGDEALVEACFRPFGDRANLDSRYVHSLCRTYCRLGNHFGRTRNEVRHDPRHLGVIRCIQNGFRSYGMFRANHAPILHQHELTVTSVLWNLILVRLATELLSMQDRCTVCAKRTIGLEIILDEPQGTPWWQGSTRSLFWSIWRQC